MSINCEAVKHLVVLSIKNVLDRGDLSVNKSLTSLIR